MNIFKSVSEKLIKASQQLEEIKEDLEEIVIETDDGNFRRQQALLSINSAISYIENDALPWLKQ